MNGLQKVVALTVLLVFPFVSVAVFVGPIDTPVLQGGTATLRCSNSDFSGGVRQWREEGKTTFADQNGIFVGDTFTKYQDFQISAPSATQIDLIIPSAKVADEGTYECEMTPDKGSAVFTVEIQGSTPIITVDGDSSGSPIILTEDVETTLRCTATGYRPAVNLEWYMNNVKITTGVSEDSPIGSGDTFETSGTLTMTPTKDDNEGSLECRTTGQQVVPDQIGSLSLNVQFKPRVKVTYEFTTSTILCSADANPVTSIQYVIFLNDTAQTPGQSLPFNNAEYGCTRVKCDVTNSVGTGTDTRSEELCPGATTMSPTTTSKPTTTMKGEIAPQVNAAVIAVAVIIPIVVLVVIILIVICFKQRKFCFAPSKTGSGGTILKKQPSASNADMIRNQPEVRQSVHKYDDEPKKPRIPRSSTGNSKKQPGNDAAPRQSGGSPVEGNRGSPVEGNRGYPAENPDGRNQDGGGQGGVNYADLEFQNRQGDPNGHGQIHYPEEEPTQYASILV
ncbi:kin of IRRE-like protein 2 isoform X3 [Asterias amurensis]|uniref:kin of IRRE-like protein 2 isoform X3 n=1 Tax=Asterias amurensis TaxID=7602 RepID=UPI003AB53E92